MLSGWGTAPTFFQPKHGYSTKHKNWQANDSLYSHLLSKHRLNQRPVFLVHLDFSKQPTRFAGKYIFFRLARHSYPQASSRPRRFESFFFNMTSFFNWLLFRHCSFCRLFFKETSVRALRGIASFLSNKDSVLFRVLKFFLTLPDASGCILMDGCVINKILLPVATFITYFWNGMVIELHMNSACTVAYAVEPFSNHCHAVYF